jgi:hypothetical protein
MSPAAAFDEQLPAPLWCALGEKMSSATAVFHPAWGLQRLGAHDILAWLRNTSPAMALDVVAWDRPMTRLAVLRIEDLRKLAGLFCLACHHGALRRCVDGGVARELRRIWGAQTIDALLADPPGRESLAMRADWSVEQLCDEGCSRLVATQGTQDWTWRLVRAAFPPWTPVPSAAVSMPSAHEFIGWCVSRLRGEAWWSG